MNSQSSPPPDVVDSVALVRSGAATPRELVHDAIDRIEVGDGRLNAVVATRFEAALQEADAVDSDLPLAGVPILLKDVGLKGEPFYLGSRRYADLDWRFSATDLFTARLQRAGAVVVGYTNVPEYLSAATTESEVYGPCRNPWDITRTAGGSSGGAGAAVAAMFVPAAQSSDGGGSSRIPASANGVFTIKPSRGRTPLSPTGAAWMDITSSKSFETRTVRDFALLLDVVAGVDPVETVGAPPPARPYVEEVGLPPGKLRIGLSSRGGGSTGPCHREALKAVADTAALLEELGHSVEEAAPATFLSDESMAIILGYWPLKVAMRAAPAEDRLGRALTAGDLERGTFKMLEQARAQTLVDFARTLDRIRDFTLRSLPWWENYDLLLTPTTGSPPPPLGLLTTPGPEARAASGLWGGLTPYANITGQPAASVPLHWTSEGLPVGLQLIAAPWREDLLPRVAAQLEQARPWAQRYV